MSKRTRESPPIEELPPTKRARSDADPDRLSALSDEILLHILCFLPTPSLITCQRLVLVHSDSIRFDCIRLNSARFRAVCLVAFRTDLPRRLSRRFHVLAGDSELWKRKYYNRWVWPRARRLRSQRMGVPPKVMGYSSKVSQWLDHSHLAATGPGIISWKNQYRLRHNWSTGVCRVTEVEVARPAIPPVLVKLEGGILFTADATKGLRAWHMKNTETSFAQIPFTDEAEEKPGAPTAITVTPHGDCRDRFEVVVGFENGTFVLYSLDACTGKFINLSTHQGNENGSITALASSSCYLLVLTQNQVLSLYRLFSKIDDDDDDESTSQIPQPQLMTSLRASNVHAPLSLSVRTVSGEIIASIAYSFSRIGCGWSVGLQELRLDEEGHNLGSRLATTVDSQCACDRRSLPAEHERYQRFQSAATTTPPRDMDFSYALSAALSSPDPPTSLSYSHPYLLLSHSNNTLTMYLAVSTSDTLAIKAGRRLWGHTSAVASVQVSDRGKAVSASARGDDIRVWELENVVSFSLSSKRALRQDGSIRLAPERLHSGASPSEGGVRAANRPKRGCGLDLALARVPDEATQTRGLVGFDEEQVVVHCEREAGSQMLGCYDFT